MRIGIGLQNPVLDVTGLSSEAVFLLALLRARDHARGRGTGRVWQDPLAH